MIITVVFTCFVYGAVIPMLFPLCLIAMVIMYTVERSMIYYSYQKPPLINDDMTKRTISTMYYAPAFGCFLAAWAFSN